ncbi:hypothetical protein J2X90_000695 [Variovorax paradoxus]|uniref:hypothetical protein n=1 Tax=Variovorax paradoxus TaxID=34073 RepID=UPI00278A2205|nr:hypothetical protein [Variovorax paradoxus]MDQ0022909.1 hypothetical protein [Variovorax paradoxus]
MQFPTLVYKCPGAHQRPGGTYAYQGVQDADEHAAALADGWFATLPEAIDGNSPVIAPAAPAPAADAPPTRAELEQKAKELGIKFDGRTGDKKLAEAIAAKVKA